MGKPAKARRRALRAPLQGRMRTKHIHTPNPLMGAFFAISGAFVPQCQECGAVATVWTGMKQTRWFCDTHMAQREAKQTWMRRTARAGR